MSILMHTERYLSLTGTVRAPFRNIHQKVCLDTEDVVSGTVLTSGRVFQVKALC